MQNARPSRRQRKRMAAEAREARKLGEGVTSTVGGDIACCSISMELADETIAPFTPDDDTRRVGAFRTISFWITVVLFGLLVSDYGCAWVVNIHDQYKSLSEDIQVPGKIVRGYEAFSQIVEDATQLCWVPDQMWSMSVIIDTYVEMSEIPRDRPGMSQPGWHGYEETAMLRESGRNSILKIFNAMDSSDQRGILRFIRGSTHPRKAIEVAAEELKSLRDKTKHFLNADLVDLRAITKEADEIVESYIAHLKQIGTTRNDYAAKLERGRSWWIRKPVIISLRYIARKINEAQTRSFEKFRTISEQNNITMFPPPGQTALAKVAAGFADYIEKMNPRPSPGDAYKIYWLRSDYKSLLWLANRLGQEEYIRKAVRETQELTERLTAWREEFQDAVPTTAPEPAIDPPPHSLKSFAMTLRPQLRQLCRLPSWPKCDAKDIVCKTAATVEENCGLLERFAKPVSKYSKSFEKRARKKQRWFKRWYAHLTGIHY